LSFLFLLAAACGGRVIVASSDNGPADGTPAAPPPSAHAVLATAGANGALCLQDALPVDEQGDVACNVYYVAYDAGECAAREGSVADDGARAALAGSVKIQGAQVACEVPQTPARNERDGTCVGSKRAVWCYVTGLTSTYGCDPAIVFSSTGPPPHGAPAYLSCR